MTEYICNFCNKAFKSNSILNNHKKTAKFCLEIQKKLTENKCEIKNDKNTSEKIEETISLVDENTINETIIDIGDDIKSEYESKLNLLQENLSLQEEVKYLKKEIRSQQEVLEQRHDIIHDLLKYREEYEEEKRMNQKLQNEIEILKENLREKTKEYITKTVPVIDNKIISNNSNKRDEDLLSPLVIKDIQSLNSKLKLEHFRTQASSLAQFYYRNLLKGRIILNDKNRNIFTYKDERGRLNRDEGGTKIFYMIISESVEYFNKYTKQYLQFLDSIPRVIRNEHYYELCTSLSNIVKACKSIEKKTEMYDNFRKGFINRIKELINFDNLAETQSIIIENKEDDYQEREDTFLTRNVIKYLPILNKYSEYVDVKAEQKGDYDDDEMFLTAVITGLEMIHKDPTTKCLYNTPEFIKYYQRAIIKIKPNMNEIIEDEWLTRQEVDILLTFN